MRKASLFVLIIGLFLSFACEKAEENYAFYRATDTANFKTNLGGELYLHGLEDEPFEIADYYLGVKAEVTTYGEEITGIGFVWSPTNSDPRLGGNNTNDTIDPNFNTEDTLAFKHRIRNLTDDTEYYVRSFITTEKDTGYNQKVTLLKTHPALNEWREMVGETNKPSGQRYDAFAFNLGDTVIMGTGNQGSESPLADIQIFIPGQGWSTLSDMPPNSDLNNKKNVTGALAFGLTFRKNQKGPAEYTTRFFVGLGDYVGANQFGDKSIVLFEYNFDKTGGAGWGSKIEFSGRRRTHAVNFIIDERVYIGTGMGSWDDPKSDWYVFYPAYAVDGDPDTEPFEFMSNIPADGLEDFGRYGAVATSVNGKGYFGLGLGGNGEFLKDWWRYTPGTEPTGGSWVEMKEFKGDPRAHAALFVIGDQIYVGGGDQVALNDVPDIEDETIVGSQPIYHDFYRYDPFNDNWTEIRPYTQDKADRADVIRTITRPIAYSNQEDGVGYVGSGIAIDPDDGLMKAQSDFWKYLPYRTDVGK